MKIGVFLTCQGRFIEAISKFLLLPTQISYVENWVLFKDNGEFPKEWMDVDVFIYQPIITAPNAYYANENLIANHVNPKAELIRVPYLMFTGYTPWRVKTDSELFGTEHRNAWLEDLGVDGNESKLRDVLYSETSATNTIAMRSLGSLKQREEEFSLMPMADWIEENFAELPLFWTPNHPRGILAYEFCNRILKLLHLPKLPPEAIYHLDGVLNIERTPIFPGVASSLGLKHKSDIAFRKYGDLLTVKEYSEHYLKAMREGEYSLLPPINITEIGLCS